MTDTNRFVEAFGGSNPLKEFFPDDEARQWVVAALGTLADFRRQAEARGDTKQVENIDDLATKAPLECLMALTAIMMKVVDTGA